ncbi:MAG: lamin tail domain-containing protein, partial [Anaerohalosphaera sp.]|nr:lamin tail domain-containing protein [Anaerohalosphaera sp.]
QITTKTPGASIIYTLDGSAPTLTNGTQVPSSGPDTIPTATVQISSTTVLRAAAFKDTFHPSNTDTQTYIFLDDIIASNVMNTAITQDPRYAPHMRQALTDLPTVSIVSNSDHLQQYIVGPYPEWAYDEFPVSIEWIMLDGSFGFQEDAGAARFGGHWYDRPGGIPFNKWSFRLYFRAEYGKPKLKAPIFEGFDHGIAPTDVFDQLDLRTGSHDMSQRGFYMSSPLTADTMLEMGNVNPHSRFVHLYINGTYWGQYNLHERWNSDMVSQYMGGEKEEYESIKTKINVGGWNDMGVPYDGDGSTWQNVLSLRNNYEQVKSWLDVQSYVDVMLMWMFGRSEEEYRCVGSIAENVVGFQFWLNDPDGFTRDVGDKTGSYGPGHIFHYLFAESNPDYRTFLADRIHEHFFNNGGLTRTAMTEKLLERCDQIDVAFFAEAARWGYRTPDSWAGARDNYINNILSSRPQTLLDQLRNAGFYPNVVAPVFHINDVYQHGGMVISGAELSMSAPAGTIYYTLDGSDPRLQGGQINPTAFSHDTGGNGDNTLITKGSTWKYLDDGTDQGAAWTDLSFNDNLWKSGAAQLGYGDGDEVTVVSFGTDPNDKFVTTYFRHTFYETDALLFTDLSGWLLRDDGAIVYLNGTEIYRSNMPAGPVGYLTPASNVTRGGAESTFNAITAIDTDLLVSGDNNITVEVHQQNITSSDISFDFELTASIDSNDLITKTPIENSTIVKSRVLKDGLWSALNEAVFGVGSVKENLLITEIMYHPAGDPNSEFIELKNVGTETINLNLVKFANGIDFIFSSVTLAAGEHVVVVKNIAAFNDRYTSFSGTVAGEYVGSLDNNGEKVRLQDALGTVIHEFSYKDGWYGITDGGGFTLTVIDPANANPAMYGNKDTWRASTHHGGSPGTDDGGPNPGDIVINELLAHSDAWPNDWIELYNASGVQIYIGGWYLSDNNDDDPNLMKYRIANGTTIAAGGYVVFTQDEHFGNAFALSENGEKVCLTSSAGGELTGYREVESFGASEVGVSLGRHYKASTDTYNFVAMSNTTKGYANAYPKVGP